MTAATLKPWYTLAEYARLTGDPLAVVKRRADRGTLRTGRIGKKRVIYLITLMAENADLYASLVAVEQVRFLCGHGHK